MAAEFDCCECACRIIAFGVDAPPDPRLCATCQHMPGWFRDPRLRAVLDPAHDGLEAWEREPLP